MLKKPIIFSICIQFALAVGCADDAPKTRERLITKQAELTDALPIIFPRANSVDCSNETSHIDSGEIFSLTQYQVTPDSIIFNNMLGSPSIQNSIVKNTRIGSKWQRECGQLNEHNGLACKQSGTNVEINFLLTETGGLLQACDRVVDFPRESPEAVAVTTAHYLEESHQTFKRNFPELKLKQVELEIFPIFESIFDFFYKPEERQTTLGYYDANNLAYLPNQQKIAVYPVKEKSSVYLWDSRFPAWHEMAHHIDFATSKRYRDCSIGINEIGSDSGHLSRKVCGAEAEALADLLAFATGPNLEDHLYGLKCLDALRNIKDGTFKNTDTKVLNNNILSYFYEQTGFNLKEQTHDEDAFGNQVRTCERPDYREIHTLGAIQGHHIYALSMLAIRAFNIQSELERSDFLYKTVVRMMRRLNKNYRNIPLQGLGRIYYVFQNVINQTIKQSSLNPEAKQALKIEICRKSRKQIQDVGFNVFQNWCSN